MFDLAANAWVVDRVLLATWETIYMVAISTFMSYVFGLPLGVILVVTSEGHILENRWINSVIGSIVNATRSVPFIIFLILIIPLTRLIVGTSIGTVASIVPLTLAAIPFVARLVETSLKEIEWGLVEAALSMGASAWQVISKVLIPEALPSLLRGVAITTINLVGYSAMAGVVGGGGLGTLAYYYGYQRYQNTVMWITVIVLIVLVQLVQMLGDASAAKITNRRR
ncbi:putative D-methionine transport system permease protein MetI [Thermacetogenium phaeum DSM 12270]|uniref:Putative D-methionine transport system permease protein MetI n=2 Tax=Thermacetogenium phaeum TaxID=85874 RepID=K4LHU0_THEPS|nr:methionine ABC transporter permease [Thermacetogenium phaeum]AFV12453.1 putative D-methionine transport system permease protein MetI [Thermacetogenium phaeum DSM 12270]KUK35694.1 MAG: Putative D-methionine transport system permease protein MetI [Thermacetogenium phaeum]